MDKIDKERAAFKKFARSFRLDMTPGKDGSYKQRDTNFAWRTWQACCKSKEEEITIPEPSWWEKLCSATSGEGIEVKLNEKAVEEAEKAIRKAKPKKIWKYEALCIAVYYVLKAEGPHTYKQLSERIGINLTALGPVLRNMTSSGKIEARGWPKMYSATE